LQRLLQHSALPLRNFQGLALPLPLDCTLCSQADSQQLSWAELYSCSWADKLHVSQLIADELTNCSWAYMSYSSWAELKYHSCNTDWLRLMGAANILYFGFAAHWEAARHSSVCTHLELPNRTQRYHLQHPQNHQNMLVWHNLVLRQFWMSKPWKACSHERFFMQMMLTDVWQVWQG